MRRAKKYALSHDAILRCNSTLADALCAHRRKWGTREEIACLDGAGAQGRLWLRRAALN
jgi:hypothetical protein